MAPVFVIAEAGSSWRFGENHIDNAYRMIRAAKECGADAVKFQWCSDAKALALRRNEPQYAEAYKYVEYPREGLALFKAEADRVGIQFGCTAFLPQDVAVISPLTDFVKVAAKEAMDRTLMEEWRRYQGKHPKRRLIVSVGKVTAYGNAYRNEDHVALHCVSQYPCPLEELRLHKHMFENSYGDNDVADGLSDHTGNVLTGAVAVGAGARVIESHVKLHDTPSDNPDYPHSHFMWPSPKNGACSPFYEYVSNVRLAERMCG